MKQLVTAKTYKPFTRAGGLYSSCTVKDEARLVSWCQNLQLPVEEAENGELHVTVIYSPQHCPPDATPLPTSGMATVIGVDLFGPEGDTLVLLLQSAFLAELHDRWRDLGCVPTFPMYRPHITLQKNVRQCDLEGFNSRIQCSPLLTVELSPEVLEDIKDG